MHQTQQMLRNVIRSVSMCGNTHGNSYHGIIPSDICLCMWPRGTPQAPPTHTNTPKHCRANRDAFTLNNFLLLTIKPNDFIHAYLYTSDRVMLCRLRWSSHSLFVHVACVCACACTRVWSGCKRSSFSWRSEQCVYVVYYQ